MGLGLKKPDDVPGAVSRLHLTIAHIAEILTIESDMACHCHWSVCGLRRSAVWI